MNIRKLKNADDIKVYLDSVNSQYIKVAITDIDGVLRGKYMHKDKFIKATSSGFGFCDVIFGWDSNDDLYELYEKEGKKIFTGWHTGYPDTKVRIIPEISAEKIPPKIIAGSIFLKFPHLSESEKPAKPKAEISAAIFPLNPVNDRPWLTIIKMPKIDRLNAIQVDLYIDSLKIGQANSAVIRGAVANKNAAFAIEVS